VIQAKADKLIGPTVEARVFLADQGDDFAEIRVLHAESAGRWHRGEAPATPLSFRPKVRRISLGYLLENSLREVTIM
jgi:hypothetical protein